MTIFQVSSAAARCSIFPSGASLAAAGSHLVYHVHACPLSNSGRLTCNRGSKSAPFGLLVVADQKRVVCLSHEIRTCLPSKWLHDEPHVHIDDTLDFVAGHVCGWNLGMLVWLGLCEMCIYWPSGSCAGFHVDDMLIECEMMYAISSWSTSLRTKILKLRLIARA